LFLDAERDETARVNECSPRRLLPDSRSLDTTGAVQPELGVTFDAKDKGV